MRFRWPMLLLFAQFDGMFGSDLIILPIFHSSRFVAGMWFLRSPDAESLRMECDTATSDQSRNLLVNCFV